MTTEQEVRRVLFRSYGNDYPLRRVWLLMGGDHQVIIEQRADMTTPALLHIFFFFQAEAGIRD